jgi:hypothetical protein
MQSSESLANIAPALAKAQAEAGRVAKSGTNTFDKYSYANLEDYTAAIKPILSKHGLSLLVSVDAVLNMDDRTTRSGGTEHAVQVTLSARLIHDSGEWIGLYAAGQGQDRADKSLYKAITGARKYLAAMVLNLATTDDPEATERPDGETPEPKKTATRKPAAKADAKAPDTTADPNDSGKCVRAFLAIGVTQEEIEQFLGTDDKPKPLVQWTYGDIERTKPLYTQEKAKQ